MKDRKDGQTADVLTQRVMENLLRILASKYRKSKNPTMVLNVHCTSLKKQPDTKANKPRNAYTKQLKLQFQRWYL